MDTHADTCCAGANWSLMELTGEVCDVNPFLNSYVWTDQTDSMEYLLVGDQTLWFGTLLPYSLINPNQIWAYGLPVNDDPFDLTRSFGIDTDHVIIPFNTTGTVVHFETRVPSEWEKTHLPIILLTSDEWNPNLEVLRPGSPSRESMEMRTVHSLISRMTRRQIDAVRENGSQIDTNGEIEMNLGQISSVYNPRDFTERLISAVNIATAYCDDIDAHNEARKLSSIIPNDRHSAATPEDLAKLWNIGLQTAKDTVRVTTQKGIRTAMMTR
jgi:hypothetical protein